MARDIPPLAGGILSYFTRHRTAANLLMVVMLVLGLAAVPNMRAQYFPDVVVDDVTVSVVWDGAGAEDVDSAVVQPLESALLAVEGVASSTSSSREGRGVDPAGVRAGLGHEPGGRGCAIGGGPGHDPARRGGRTAGAARFVA